MNPHVSPPAPHDTFDENVLVEYCQAVHRSFLAAGGGADDRVERDFRIGGHSIRLTSPSPRVADKMGAALAHLRIEAQADPDLTICLWDSAGPRARPKPPSPWGWYAEHHGDGRIPNMRYNSHGELTDFCSARVYTAFRIWTQKLRVLDSEQGLAYYWTEDIDQIPGYEFCAPFRKILAWWMSARSQQIVHAAAVGTEDAGVLLAGKGGTGKSTTALACLGSPLRYAGDDCCLLVDGEPPRINSLYNSAKLKTPRELMRFPGLAEVVQDATFPDGEKVFMFLQQHRPSFLSAGFPIRALLVPRVAGTASTRLEPVSSAMGLAALAPSTLRLFPGLERDATRRMARFVSQVPCYRLLVGTDLRRIPEVILELLERL
jgi:hypothetical protein